MLAAIAALVVGIVAVPRLLATGDEDEAPGYPPRREPAPEPRESAARAPEAPRTSDPKPSPKPAPEQPKEPGLSEERARKAANELAALTTLRLLVSAQAHFQATARADEDEDGVGEYGSFGELSGAETVRDSGQLLEPPVLAAAFKDVKHGYVERSGYRFRVFLPQEDGQPTPERDTGGFGRGEAGPDLAEAYWCAYAWPAEGSGRAFFVNQDGEILATAAGAYSGDRKPDAYAAFRRTTGLTAPLATTHPSSKGTDQREWNVE